MNRSFLILPAVAFSACLPLSVSPWADTRQALAVEVSASRAMLLRLGGSEGGIALEAWLVVRAEQLGIS